MGERLTSVGLDVGTTTTQLIVSELTVENRASGFAVPELAIAQRQIRYRGQVHFTPLLGEELVDGAALRELVAAEYEKAGLRRGQVDTGAVIITGETSRKENAATVLENLADLAGEFVVATAGPHLESVLAAKGAGAVAWSEQTGKRVLHFDIGGGTSNWALIEAGRIVKTGCLNVGGRLLKFDQKGNVTYVSPVLQELCKLNVGDTDAREEAEGVAQMLVQALEMAAGLREATPLLERLVTKEARNETSLRGGSGGNDAAIPSGFRNDHGIATPVCGLARNDSGEVVISFSGGVADCIEKELPWLEFGDLGPLLGKAIRQSRLCAGEYRLGAETIRATVIGAGCHSTQLSGSTVFYRNITFPLKNLPVVTRPEALKGLDGPGVLALPGFESPSYGQVRDLARELADTVEGPVLLALEADMAKALGHALVLLLPADRPILCIDRVRLREGDYLDVGAPIGPALPVVVKTLILER